MRITPHELTRRSLASRKMFFTSGCLSRYLSGTNGRSVVIEGSTNLAGWEAISTNTTPTNVLFHTDPEAGSHRWRFYRAFQSP